jgi:protein involved in polysaccharide export with SLBB domain
MAAADEGYPVTPGDVYSVSYLAAGQAAVFDVTVQSDYTLDLRLFGRVNASGLTFSALRRRVQAGISALHPEAAPALTIRSTGLFSVRLSGAVTRPGYETVWGLTRLSEILASAMAPYGSDRDVVVRSSEGAERTCDVFSAVTAGDEGQDPRLRPGDTVTVAPASLTVEVFGEVRRPGTFRLREGEAADLLLELYCRGFTPRADAGRLRLERGGGGGGSVSYHTFAELSALALGDGDRITVAARNEVVPVVFFEGAVQSERREGLITQERLSELEAPYGRLSIPFVAGETVLNAFLSVQDRILPLADPSAAVILRRGEPAPIAVDIESLLAKEPSARDEALAPYDRVVIPAIRYFVTVSGAVVNPGTYIFAPGHGPDYYVALAGGVDRERTAGRRLVLLDADGRRVRGQENVPAGARIVVPSSSFVYGFNRYFPVLATTLSFATAAVSFLILVDWWQP